VIGDVQLAQALFVKHHLSWSGFPTAKTLRMFIEVLTGLKPKYAAADWKSSSQLEGELPTAALLIYLQAFSYSAIYRTIQV
jgi:hypothetical protein